MTSFEHFGDTGVRFTAALLRAPIPADALEQLKSPKRIVKVAIPVRMDDGRLQVFPGMRIVYNDRRGPGKGGLRFHPQVSEEEMVSLSFRLLIKCAVNDLPFGGANGGVAVDPKTLSEGELERLSRGFVDALIEVIGPDTDILSPDINTHDRIMAWMLDQYNLHKRQFTPAVATGKPLSLGGSRGRALATAHGALTVLAEVRRRRGDLQAGCRVAIQGFGNAGGKFASVLHAAGYQVVAVSDSRQALYASGGLDIPWLMEVKRAKGTLAAVDLADARARATGCQAIGPEELLEVDADVLAPSALAGQIHAGNAGRIKARYVLEVANGPTTPEAERILLQRGCVLVPDVVANAGGVTASYFEWVQNRQGLSWTEEELGRLLEERMTRQARAMLDCAEALGIPLTTAAYVMGIERLAGALA